MEPEQRTRRSRLAKKSLTPEQCPPPVSHPAPRPGWEDASHATERPGSRPVRSPRRDNWATGQARMVHRILWLPAQLAGAADYFGRTESTGAPAHRHCRPTSSVRQTRRSGWIRADTEPMDGEITRSQRSGPPGNSQRSRAGTEPTACALLAAPDRAPTA